MGDPHIDPVRCREQLGAVMQMVWVGSEYRLFCFGDYLADGRWLDEAPPPEGRRVALHTEGWLLSLEYQVPAPVVLEVAAQPPSLGSDWRLMAHAPLATATGKLGLVDVPMGPIGELLQVPVGVHECFAYRRIVDPTMRTPQGADPPTWEQWRIVVVVRA